MHDAMLRQLLPLLVVISSLNLPCSSHTIDPLLETEIIPLSYDLTVRFPPDVQGVESFSGSLALHFMLPSRSSSVVLHSSDLHAFRNVSLLRMDGWRALPRGIRIRKQTVEFKFDPLLSGEYVLSIGEYAGGVSDGSAGVFRRGRRVFTHLQPSFARRLLPCIDRPSIRAPFRIIVEHSHSTVAFSNTASVEERLLEDGETKRTTFAPTPALPAYLVAFSILPDSLIEVSGQTSFGVVVRVIGDRRESVVRTLRAALPAFEFIAELIQLPLPLNKARMDLLLVSEYEGGMENWGHILLSSSLADSADDAHLLHLVAHELAHHWVGNAATVSTWAHICLQEDLTELLAHKTLRALLPRTDFERFRLAKYVEIQLAEDIVSPGHPLLLPSEITPQMIWMHCYLKGVILLESLEDVLGEEFLLSVIRDIVTGKSVFDLHSFSSYLKPYPIDENATLADVYTHWYTTGGYPMVHVSTSEAEDNDSGEKGQAVVTVEQRGPGLWPLRLVFSDGTSGWQLANSLSLPVHSISDGRAPLPSPAPLLLNLNFTSFMRVNYDNSTWNEILDALEQSASSFSPLARAQFISDLCFFSTTQSVDVTLVQRALSVVYSQPHHFDLCDWSLLWCRNGLELSASAILQRALVNLSSFFSSASDYSCRSGQAIRAVNKLCLTLFSKICI